MVRADDSRDVAGLRLTDLHAAMATRVVERMNATVVAPDDDDRVGVDVEDEEITRAPHLARVAGEEPTASPDALEVELIDARIGLELALQGVAWRVLRD